MQALLEERFKLKLHRETREGPVYELVVAKGGPKLKPFEEGSCVPFDATKQTPGRPPVPPPGERFCDSSRTRGGPLGLSEVISAQGVSLQWVAYALSADRPVVDKTGLTGLFDVHLEFEPDRATFPPPAPPGAPPIDTSDQPPGSIGPSIFTAIQEQLGLKLESAKGPREVLVIDSVERPSEN
jgi:uncharacterized protein (TIGR03435 family)